LFRHDLLSSIIISAAFSAIIIVVVLVFPEVILGITEWDLKDIYIGMVQFMVLQIIGLILIIIFLQIVLWLPNYIYGP
jgi:hypothetical protein